MSIFFAGKLNRTVAFITFILCFLASEVHAINGSPPELNGFYVEKPSMCKMSVYDADASGGKFANISRLNNGSAEWQECAGKVCQNLIYKYEPINNGYALYTKTLNFDNKWVTYATPRLVIIDGDSIYFPGNGSKKLNRCSTGQQDSFRFICPEKLKNENEQKRELEKFINWANANNPGITLSGILALRQEMLASNNCTKTLQNLQKSGSSNDDGDKPMNNNMKFLCTGAMKQYNVDFNKNKNQLKVDGIIYTISNHIVSKNSDGKESFIYTGKIPNTGAEFEFNLSNVYYMSYKGAGMPQIDGCVLK